MTSRLISRLGLGSRQIFTVNNLLTGTKLNTTNNKINYLNQIKNEFHLSSFDLYAAPTQIKMPALSPTMTEGTIVKWHKKEGDKIQPGDILLEVQTDKAVIPFELEEEGTIAKILVPQDSSTIQVGSPIALMVNLGEDWKNVSLEGVNLAGSSSSSASSAPKQEAAQSSTSQSDHGSVYDKKIGPAARLLINSYQIDPSVITVTGPHGIITKSYIDVKAHILKNNLSPVAPPKSELPSAPSQKTPAAASVAAGSSVPSTSASTPRQPSFDSDREEIEYEDIELTNMRKVIAKRLLQSKTTIPHSYISSNIVVDKIVNLRKEMIKNNQKVSLNDFIIKALALALRIVPEVNSNLDAKSGEYKQLPTVDISVAVATDKGLITPIVKNADRLSVQAISETVKTLADKARQGKLLPHEFQGGSFSISNLGMFGVTEFSAVINPPQLGIMAIGKSQLKFNVDLKPQTEVAFTLSYDERGVDLDRAMKFMNTISYFISNPELLVEQTQSL